MSFSLSRRHKLGGVPNDKAELILEALAALLETKGLRAQKCPRGHQSSRPPVQIHVHEDKETGRMTVPSDSGERELGRAPLSGARLLKNPVSGSASHQTAQSWGNQPLAQPGDSLWCLPPVVARAGWRDGCASVSDPHCINPPGVIGFPGPNPLFGPGKVLSCFGFS